MKISFFFIIEKDNIIDQSYLFKLKTIFNCIIPKVTLGKRLMATPSSCRGSSQSLDTTESSGIVGTPPGSGKTPHHSGPAVDRLLINDGMFVEIYPFKYYVHENLNLYWKNNHIAISLELYILIIQKEIYEILYMNPCVWELE